MGAPTPCTCQPCSPPPRRSRTRPVLASERDPGLLQLPQGREVSDGRGAAQLRRRRHAQLGLGRGGQRAGLRSAGGCGRSLPLAPQPPPRSGSSGSRQAWRGWFGASDAVCFGEANTRQHGRPCSHGPRAGLLLGPPLVLARRRPGLAERPPAAVDRRQRRRPAEPDAAHAVRPAVALQSAVTARLAGWLVGLRAAFSWTPMPALKPALTCASSHPPHPPCSFGPIDGVTLGELLGRGAFGRVYKGATRHESLPGLHRLARRSTARAARGVGPPACTLPAPPSNLAHLSPPPPTPPTRQPLLRRALARRAGGGEGG